MSLNVHRAITGKLRAGVGAEFYDGDELMETAGIGWIMAIIIGGLAGWIASRFMNSGTGILMNVVLGVIGAAVASFLFGLLGVSFGGWIGYLVAGFLGACILIAAARAIRR